MKGVRVLAIFHLVLAASVQLISQTTTGRIIGKDDWRATKAVDAEPWPRHEFSSVVQEANNLLGNFDPNLGLVQVGHQISNLYNPDHTNFGHKSFWEGCDCAFILNTASTRGANRGLHVTFLAFANLTLTKPDFAQDQIP